MLELLILSKMKIGWNMYKKKAYSSYLLVTTKTFPPLHRLICCAAVHVRELGVLLLKLVHKTTCFRASLSFADIPARTTRSADAINIVPFRSQFID